MEKNIFVQSLLRLVESNRASTYFLNGSPGSGKSYLLNSLVSQLPSKIRRSFILGPYEISSGNVYELGRLILKDCAEAGFSDLNSPHEEDWDLIKTWNWFSENSWASTKQTFIVLIDIGTVSSKNLTQISTLFSNARYFEGIWDSSTIRLHYVFAGYWDHPSCVEYYRKINTSFPYTIGHNYTVWTGISKDAMIDLVKEYHPSENRVPFGQILYELTGGHPGAAIDILDQIESNDLSIPNLLQATKRAAVQGSTSHSLLELWTKLPRDSKRALKEMSLQRRIRATTLPPHLDRLRIAGIARQNHIGEQYYLDFQSWYVELIVRSHAEQLGIANDKFRLIEDDDLIPSTSTVSTEAFRLIHEIENLTRNYVTTYLSLQSETGFHYLMGKSRKKNSNTGVYEDAYKRAEEWRMQSAERGLPPELNPLIAYLSTRDLANLIEELGAESGLTEWMRIAQAIRALSDVRDAVMHNQIIDDDAFHQLFVLQEEIYEALSINQS
jgi:hypothetical protein